MYTKLIQNRGRTQYPSGVLQYKLVPLERAGRISTAGTCMTSIELNMMDKGGVCSWHAHFALRLPCMNTYSYGFDSLRICSYLFVPIRIYSYLFVFIHI